MADITKGTTVDPDLRNVAPDVVDSVLNGDAEKADDPFSPQKMADADNHFSGAFARTPVKPAFTEDPDEKRRKKEAEDADAWQKYLAEEDERAKAKKKRTMEETASMEQAAASMADLSSFEPRARPSGGNTGIHKWPTGQRGVYTKFYGKRKGLLSDTSMSDADIHKVAADLRKDGCHNVSLVGTPKVKDDLWLCLMKDNLEAFLISAKHGGAPPHLIHMFKYLSDGAFIPGAEVAQKFAVFLDQVLPLPEGKHARDAFNYMFYGPQGGPFHLDAEQQAAAQNAAARSKARSGRDPGPEDNEPPGGPDSGSGPGGGGTTAPPDRKKAAAAGTASNARGNNPPPDSFAAADDVIQPSAADIAPEARAEAPVAAPKMKTPQSAPASIPLAFESDDGVMRSAKAKTEASKDAAPPPPVAVAEKPETEPQEKTKPEDKAAPEVLGEFDADESAAMAEADAAAKVWKPEKAEENSSSVSPTATTEVDITLPPAAAPPALNTAEEEKTAPVIPLSLSGDGNVAGPQSASALWADQAPGGQGPVLGLVSVDAMNRNVTREINIPLTAGKIIHRNEDGTVDGSAETGGLPTSDLHDADTDKVDLHLTPGKIKTDYLEFEIDQPGPAAVSGVESQKPPETAAETSPLPEKLMDESAVTDKVDLHLGETEPESPAAKVAPDTVVEIEPQKILETAPAQPGALPERLMAEDANTEKIPAETAPPDSDGDRTPAAAQDFNAAGAAVTVAALPSTGMDEANTDKTDLHFGEIPPDDPKTKIADDAVNVVDPEDILETESANTDKIPVGTAPPTVDLSGKKDVTVAEEFAVRATTLNKVPPPPPARDKVVIDSSIPGVKTYGPGEKP